MKNTRLRRLLVLERYRKLTEDESRLKLAKTKLERDSIQEACDECEEDNQGLETIRREEAENGIQMNVTRYLVVGECIQDTLQRLDNLLEERDICEQRCSVETVVVSEAWRHHEAVTRRRERQSKEMRYQTEMNAYQENAELWLTRCLRHE